MVFVDFFLHLSIQIQSSLRNLFKTGINKELKRKNREIQELTEREFVPTENDEARKGFLWIKVGLIAAISETNQLQQALRPISNDNFTKKLNLKRTQQAHRHEIKQLYEEKCIENLRIKRPIWVPAFPN